MIKGYTERRSGGGRRTLNVVLARAAADCPFCDIRIKAGQQVALWFSTNEWGHAGCVVREASLRNPREAIA